jgi:hypothetical protein
MVIYIKGISFEFCIKGQKGTKFILKKPLNLRRALRFLGEEADWGAGNAPLSLSLSLSTFKCISSFATKKEFHVLSYTQKGGLVFMHISMEE